MSNLSKPLTNGQRDTLRTFAATKNKPMEVHHATRNSLLRLGHIVLHRVNASGSTEYVATDAGLAALAAERRS